MPVALRQVVPQLLWCVITTTTVQFTHHFLRIFSAHLIAYRMHQRLQKIITHYISENIANSCSPTAQTATLNSERAVDSGWNWGHPLIDDHRYVCTFGVLLNSPLPTPPTQLPRQPPAYLFRGRWWSRRGRMWHKQVHQVSTKVHIILWCARFAWRSTASGGRTSNAMLNFPSPSDPRVGSNWLNNSRGRGISTS